MREAVWLVLLCQASLCMKHKCRGDHCTPIFAASVTALKRSAAWESASAQGSSRQAAPQRKWGALRSSVPLSLRLALLAWGHGWRAASPARQLPGLPGLPAAGQRGSPGLHLTPLPLSLPASSAEEEPYKKPRAISELPGLWAVNREPAFVSVRCCVQR